ncbi:MAG: hypothetical protein BroJett021_28130 [Chloroflexota bacterium]|nr:MAG: hypothetical protein BroJett021_28130 [Chloroflexota bacterium]
MEQINLLPNVPPLGRRYLARNARLEEERLMIYLREHAPAWARWWSQNECGSGYYWEHEPECDERIGYWCAQPGC